MEPQTSSNKNSVLLTIVVLILIGAAIYYVWQAKNNAQPTTPAVEHVQNVVTKSFIGTGSQSKIPDDFPTNIPVELANLIDSYTAFYKDHNSTLASVTYTSTKTKDNLWTLYSNFIKDNNYTLNTQLTDKAHYTMVASKANTTLTIVISTANNKSTVHISQLTK